MDNKEYSKTYNLETNDWWFVSKRRFIKNILNKYVGKKSKLKILDIGCGMGRNLELLKEFGQVHGIDISPLAIKFCKKRGLKNLKIGLADKLPYKKNSMDLITMFDVLYHESIKNDGHVISEISRVLKKNGFILLTDCALNFLKGPHDKIYCTKRRYTCREIKQLLEKNKFKIIKLSYTFFITFPIFLLTRLTQKITNKSKGIGENSKITNLILMNILKIEAFFLKYYNFPFGSSIIVLAKKIN